MKQAVFVGALLCAGLAAHMGHAAPQGGISLYGDLKYKTSFTHYGHVNPNAPKRGKFRFGVLGTFDSLNPFVIKGTPASGATVLYPSLLFATLTSHSLEEAFSEYGYVAQTIDVAPDHSSVTFVLRAEATFHDGSPIRAQDIAFTFKTLVEKGHPLYRNYYSGVKEVVVVDDHTVRFDFKTNDNRELPLVLGQMPILSEAFYKTHKFEEASLTPPMSSGPYKVSQVKAGHSITYERLKDWWGEKLPVNKGRYNFDEVTYEYYRDDTVAFEAFKSGGYDMRLERAAKNWVEGYNIDAVKQGKLKRFETYDKNPKPMVGLTYNIRRDLFKDAKVREALSYAFDFEWANKHLFYGRYKRTHSYYEGSEMASTDVPQARELEILSEYRAQLPQDLFTKPFTLPTGGNTRNVRANLEHAKNLLQQAGYVVEKGILIYQTTKKPLEIELLLVQPDFEKVLQNFLTNLKRLGIKVTLRPVDTAQYMARMDSFDYDMIVGGFAQSPSPGNEQKEFWSSATADAKGSRNFVGIKNKVVDALVARIDHATTREELVAIIKALDRVLLWQHYVIPLYHQPANPIAYWSHIQFPEKIPDYGIDLEACWDASKGK